MSTKAYLAAPRVWTWLTAAGMGISGVQSIPTQRVTVIGQWPYNEVLAERVGGRFLNIPMSVWDKLSPDERWAVNKRFLEEAIRAGDRIILATPGDMARSGSYFMRELHYLMSRGYRLVEGKLELIRGPSPIHPRR